MAENEVVIHVVVKQGSTKAGFEAVGKDADVQARKISESFSSKFAETIKAKFQNIFGQGGGGASDTATTSGRSWGERFGRAAGDRISVTVNERIRRDGGTLGRMFSGGGNGGSGGDGGRGGRGGDAKVTVDVDVDKQSIFSRLFSTGKEGAMKFADGFKSSAESALSGIFSGDILSSIVKGISVAALVAVFAPVLGAAVSAAIGLALGGGVLAAGIAGAFKDPIVAGAAKGTLANLKADLEDFGKSFTAPLENFFVKFDQLMDSISPQVKDLASDFAPVATALGNGLIGLLQNALPGILRAADGAAPLIKVLADKLPMIGDSIGRFFDHINESGPQAQQFLGDLLEGVGLLIRVFGTLVEVLAIAYGDMRVVFAGIINGLADVLVAAAKAFYWVPGLGPKLAAAAGAVDTFRNKFNDSFKKLKTDITVNIRINVVGLSAARAAIDLGTKLAKMGYAHGGVVGAATGGLHGGLRMVGEHGPELLELPPGTRVNSNPDTERMMGGEGGILQQVIQLVVDGQVIAQAMAEPLRADIRSLGQGSVQKYLGQPGVA